VCWSPHPGKPDGVARCLSLAHTDALFGGESEPNVWQHVTAREAITRRLLSPLRYLHATDPPNRWLEHLFQRQRRFRLAPYRRRRPLAGRWARRLPCSKCRWRRRGSSRAGRVHWLPTQNLPLARRPSAMHDRRHLCVSHRGHHQCDPVQLSAHGQGRSVGIAASRRRRRLGSFGRRCRRVLSA
jgi:hypothetical protein